MPLLSIENLSIAFRSNPEPVVRDISFSLEKGEMLALVGESGSGKSVTALSILQLLDPGAAWYPGGSIRFEGTELLRASDKTMRTVRGGKIGFIFQDYNLIPTLTAFENIAYVLWLQRVPAGERRKRVFEICERFGIASLINRRPSKLSRGQQQRVAVARAIAHKPKIVLGDELTANLDHKTGAELMDFLKELNQKDGITFVYATHDPVMMQRASRIVKIQDGMIVDGEAK